MCVWPEGTSGPREAELLPAQEEHEEQGAVGHRGPASG